MSVESKGSPYGVGQTVAKFQRKVQPLAGDACLKHPATSGDRETCSSWAGQGFISRKVPESCSPA